jgi:general secretion pathway protein G
MTKRTKRTNRAQGDEGFTLIELLVVIVILGTLAAVVVFAVGGLNDRGVEAACKAEVQTVQVAVEAFRAKTGDYPATFDDLTTGDDIFLKSAPENNNGYEVALGPDGVVTVDPGCDGL